MKASCVLIFLGLLILGESNGDEHFQILQKTLNGIIQLGVSTIDSIVHRHMGNRANVWLSQFNVLRKYDVSKSVVTMFSSSESKQTIYD